MKSSTPPGTTLFLKDHNLRLVRQALRTAQIATVRDLVDATGLSSVTVGSVLQGLVADGTAREDEAVPSNGGRPSRSYRYCPTRSVVVTVLTREIEGRDSICFRVSDLYGMALATEVLTKTPTCLEDFEPVLDRLIAAYPQVAALGFGLPGVEVDGTIVTLDYAGLIGAPILEHFNKRYRVPVVFENDVNAAVLGRGGRPGAAASEVYLYVPSQYAPGAGIRLDGRLLKGRRHFAGEVSFLPLGIRWGDRALVESLELSCDAIARVVASLAAVVNPDSVVLFGEFLTAAHLEVIDRRCRGLLPPSLAPVLSLSEDFTQDFEEGLISLTLERLAL